MAILNVCHQIDEIRNANMTKQEKDDASNGVYRNFSLLAVDLWPTEDDQEHGTLLKSCYRTGIAFLSPEPVDQEGNGFSVDRSQIGPLCEVLGQKQHGKTWSLVFKTLMKSCGLQIFSGDKDKVFCFHKFIRPGGEELAKRLTRRNLQPLKDLEVYEKIPLGFVRNDECEFATNPEIIIHSY